MVFFFYLNNNTIKNQLIPSVLYGGPSYKKEEIYVKNCKGNPFRLNENLTSYNLAIKFYYKFQ